MTTRSIWCESALIDGVVQYGVTIDIDAERITAVIPDSTAREGASVRAGLSVAGLANSHSHAFHRALRSRTQADRGDFWTWRTLMYEAAQRLTPDSYHSLARAVFAEMAMAGITCVGEFHYVHHQPDGTRYADPNAMGEALLSAAGEAGIRITLLDTLYLHGGLGEGGYSALQPLQWRFGDATAEAWAERVSGLRPTDGQRVGAAIHSVRAVDPLAMKTLGQWAVAEDVPVHAHVSEQPAENDSCLVHFRRTPTQVLHDAGVVNGRFSAVHATHVTDGDIGLLAANGATVVMCPTTERDLADGIGPAAALAGAGIPLALGSDSHAVVDMFEEARLVEMHERLASRRRGTLSATALLAAASLDGHRSLGWDDAGTLAVGQRADLVTVGLDSVRTAGAGTAATLEAAVFSAAAGDVTDVTVDGRDIVRSGAHLTLDVARELDAAVTALMTP